MNRVSGNLRPGWLADDGAWRDQLDALPPADAEWLAEQWRIAGGGEPAIDTSWMTFETVGPVGPWDFLQLIGVAMVFALVLMAVCQLVGVAS